MSCFNLAVQLPQLQDSQMSLSMFRSDSEDRDNDKRTLHPAHREETCSDDEIISSPKVTAQ